MASRIRLGVWGRWLLPISLALLIALLALPAQAAFYVCRGDPIVELSDGNHLNIWVALTVPGAHVRDVTFTLHLPPSVTVKKVTYPKGDLDHKEFVVVVNDAAAGTFVVDTEVRLLTASVAEVMTLVEQTDGKKKLFQSDTAFGLAGNLLSLRLDRYVRPGRP